MRRQIIVGILATLIVIGALGGVKVLQIRRAIAEAKMRKTPPSAVTSFKAAAEDWPIELASVGELAPVRGAVLAAEEGGRVAAVRFESGTMVQQGQVLVELDTSLEQAQLKAAEAAYDLARLELGRQRSLRSSNANAVSDLDRADANHRSALAERERLKAQIARKQIIAPFAGQTGARLVNEGQVLPPGTPVVSLQSLDRLYLNFTAPQRFVSQLAPGLAVNFRVDAFPGKTFHGSLTTVEPAVNAETRNIGLQATVPNPDLALRPGMFAEAAVILPAAEKVIAIPASSVSYAPYGDTVYVLEQMKGTDGAQYLGARRQIVKLGRRRGDMIAVAAGLNPGDEVVSSGAFKLMPGAPVFVNNSIAPGSAVNPQTSDT